MSEAESERSEFAARPQALAELVDYHDDAIVSRTILKKGTGTITVFAFDAEQGLSEHTAPFDALVQVLEGSAEVTISGKVHRVAAGEILVIPAHEPHALRAVERFKMCLVMIKS